MPDYVVDTHALIWYLENNPRLGAKAREAISEPNSKLYIPVTVLAESLWMIENGRTAIPTATDLLADLDSDTRVEIVPLTRDIVMLTEGLTPIGEMHDRQIVATAINLSRHSTVTLITRDENINSSGLIPTVW